MAYIVSKIDSTCILGLNYYILCRSVIIDFSPL